MLSSIIRRSATRTKLHRFYLSLACNNYTLATNQCPSKVPILQCITLKHNTVSHRNIGDTRKGLLNFLPLLPGYVEKIKPVLADLLIYMVERWTLQALIDPEFNMEEITKAAKSAASKVSIELANQNFDALKDLVEESVLAVLKAKINLLVPEQRKLIAFREEDIKVCSPSFIKLQSKSFSPEQKSYNVIVDINLIICYEPFYGIVGEERDEKNELIQSIRKGETEIPPELYANYTFSREYTENEGSDWIITHINVDV